MQEERNDRKNYDIDKVDRWLKEFTEGERAIDGQIERLERLQSKLESYGAQEISDMPRSPSPPTDRVTLMVARKIELEQELRVDVKSQAETRRRIEYVLNHVDKAREKTVIRMRYLDDESWDSITFAIFGGLQDYTSKYRNYVRRSHLLCRAAKYDMAKYFTESGDPEVSFFDSYIPRSLD